MIARGEKALKSMPRMHALEVIISKEKSLRSMVARCLRLRRQNMLSLNDRAIQLRREKSLNPKRPSSVGRKAVLLAEIIIAPWGWTLPQGLEEDGMSACGAIKKTLPL